MRCPWPRRGFTAEPHPRSMGCRSARTPSASLCAGSAEGPCCECPCAPAPPEGSSGPAVPGVAPGTPVFIWDTADSPGVAVGRCGGFTLTPSAVQWPGREPGVPELGRNVLLFHVVMSVRVPAQLGASLTAVCQSLPFSPQAEHHGRTPLLHRPVPADLHLPALPFHFGTGGAPDTAVPRHSMDQGHPLESGHGTHGTDWG